MNDLISSKQRRFMVTGSSGQLGVRTVDALVESGHAVIALDRRQPSSESRSRSNLVEYVTYSLEDLGNTPQSFQDSTAEVTDLVHLASRIADIPTTSADAPGDLMAEVLGTVDLLRLVPNVRSIVFSSSEMVYGSVNAPLLAEDSAIRPTNLYGVLKATLEDYLLQYGISDKCRISILRLASVYGTSLEGSQALPSFIRAALTGEPPVISGPPDVRRDRVHVDDVISAIMVAIDNEKSGIFNIGSGTASSTIELAQAVVRIANSSVDPVIQQSLKNMAEVASCEMDISKARRELGYAPKFDLHSGLKAVIEKFG
jgi:UDP-glucose 4-epimerase